MIRTFRHADLAKLWEIGRPLQYKMDIANDIIRILDILDSSERAQDADFAGLRWDSWQKHTQLRYGITLSDRWLISYSWDEKDAVDVDFETIN